MIQNNNYKRLRMGQPIATISEKNKNKVKDKKDCQRGSVKLMIIILTLYPGFSFFFHLLSLEYTSVFLILVRV